MIEQIDWQRIYNTATQYFYPEGLHFLVAVAALVVSVNVMRFFAIYLLRELGLYSPAQYHNWSHYVPWRFFYRIWLKLADFYEFVFLLGKRGNTGGFASWLQTLSLLYTSEKIHLGRAMAFGVGLLQPIGIRISRHALFVAMTGSGKTTALISMIALFKGSVFFIDPKAQIVGALATHDKKRKWFVLDPHGISDIESACFNVFDCIKEAMKREGESAAVLWAMRVAEAIVATPPNSTQYFYEVSRQFLAGLILHVLTFHDEEHHNLCVVRDLIVNGYRLFDEYGEEQTQETEPHELMLRMMADNPAYDGFIAGAVSSLKSASGDTGGNVRSTLQEQTKWLDIPDVRAVIKSSSFSLSDLKTRRDMVLAFTAPLSSLREELSRFSRLLTNMTYYTFEAVKDKNGQCLTVIDELPSQGYNPTLEVMLAAGRSMGQTLVGVIQNIELLFKNYPKSAKTFIGEADFCAWLGGNHPDNAELLSKLLDKKTIIERDRRTGHKTRREVDVMTSDQVRRYLDPETLRLIVTRASGRALRLLNDPYYKALPVWMYAPDPEHGDQFYRKITRFLLRCFLSLKERMSGV